jgi:hypothetical protein
MDCIWDFKLSMDADLGVEFKRSLDLARRVFKSVKLTFEAVLGKWVWQYTFPSYVENVEYVKVRLHFTHLKHALWKIFLLTVIDSNGYLEYMSSAY